MSLVLVGGAVSLSALIIGVRLYNVYYVWGSYKDMIKKENEVNEDNNNSLNGYTIIVTGANSGIGRETARELYKNGARIIMACRNEKETTDVIDRLKNLYPTASGQLVYKHLNLASFDSVKKFSDEIITEEPHLNMLINNAAVFGAPISVTNDGFEFNMQVNHLAPALLTILLLPKLQVDNQENLKTTISNKVIMVTSTLYKNGKVDDNLFNKLYVSVNLSRRLLTAEFYRDVSKIETLNKDHKTIYSSTKLANLLFTRQLYKKAEIVKNVNICLASPGFALTRLHRYAGKKRLAYISLFAPLFAMILKSPEQGAQTIIGCAMADKVRPDVLYQHCKANENHFKVGVAAENSSTSEHVFQITMNALKDYI